MQRTIGPRPNVENVLNAVFGYKVSRCQRLTLQFAGVVFNRACQTFQ